MSSVGALKKKPQTANPAGRTKKSVDFKVSSKPRISELTGVVFRLTTIISTCRSCTSTSKSPLVTKNLLTSIIV